VNVLSIFDPTVRDKSRTASFRSAIRFKLSSAVLALLAGRTSPKGIAPFGRDQGTSLAPALGFRRGKPPMLPRSAAPFRCLDVNARTNEHQTALRLLELEHFQLHCCPAPLIADGVQRSLSRFRMGETENALLPLTGKIVTGDAEFCQTEMMQTIREHGGDYLLHVKDNQPTVREAIAERLDPTGAFPSLFYTSRLPPRRPLGSPRKSWDS
jgi:hypothetical protein